MKKIIFVVLLAATAFQICAEEYYVSEKGSDTNSGSINSPFKTISKAASILKAGDICLIREGSYHEKIRLETLHGTKSQPIIFKAYQNEKVTLDGSVPIQSKWEKYNGDIYQTKIERQVWQLFVDGKSMCSARWPNGNWNDGSVWDKTKSMMWPEKGKFGNYINESLKDLDFSLEDGGILIVNSGSFKTYKALITGHLVNSNNFTFDTTNVKVHFSYKGKVEKHAYFLEGKKELIDTNGEWFYEPKTQMLYLQTEKGTNPNKLNIRGKVQSYAIQGKNSSFIKIEGIHFFGTTVNFQNCKNITIADCNFLYPSYSKRMLRDLSPMDVTKLLVKDEFSPANHIIRNCRFEYMDGPTLELNGVGNRIENCYIHAVDYSCTYAGGYTMNMINATELVFRRNTIHTTGASETFKAGRRNLIELNDISNTGFMQNDGSTIQISVKQQDKSVTRNNWVHNTVKQGLRFDNSNLPNSPWGENGTMHHNVAWKTDRIFFKGDKHFIFNNLSFDSHQNDLIISSNTAICGFNYQTVTRNNICNKFSGHRTKPGKDHPVPGIVDHNWAGNFKKKDIRTQLRDPDNLDFRPRAKSELIDAGKEVKGKTIPYLGKAPDIGPYEYGDTNYWIPGFKDKVATVPIPVNKTKTAKPNADLMWLGAYKAAKFKVYFGTSPDNLELKAEQTNNIYTPENLVPGETYYWRVDCFVNGDISRGKTWSFTVN